MAPELVQSLHRLFDLFENQGCEHLKAPLLGLVLGQDLAAAIASHFSCRPTVAHLTETIQLIRREAPELANLEPWLIYSSDLGFTATLEDQLEQLLEAEPDSWSHPSQVLERELNTPWADLDSLLRACTLRRNYTEPSEAEAERLESVLRKLDYAVQIAQRAQERREEREEGRRRAPLRSKTETSEVTLEKP